MPREQPNVERAVERLSEDEALRGSLEDDGYGPLLEAAASLALARADRFASTEALYLALRALLAAAVRAAERRDVAELAAAAVPLLGCEGQNSLARNLPRLGSDANRNGQVIAAALARAAGIPTR